ncbi:Aste57867_18533 [Aphanomyces stellatus]|uniref:Aste57867_18533 protein n=1 Tax=Aphanomyces stellatus TaxID=120398 RepID=A0A485LBZ6_9STRA|nr:hypothetical protein As57867_018471 [Aphanomyces stellatus]VFT95269.1 Aste57867_18533 [Aphanomyces stellatus]
MKSALEASFEDGDMGVDVSGMTEPSAPPPLRPSSSSSPSTTDDGGAVVTPRPTPTKHERYMAQYAASLARIRAQQADLAKTKASLADALTHLTSRLQTMLSTIDGATGLLDLQYDQIVRQRSLVEGLLAQRQANKKQQQAPPRMVAPPDGPSAAIDVGPPPSRAASQDEASTMPQECRWDVTRCGRLGAVSNGGRTVVTMGKGWNVAVGDRPHRSFSARVTFPNSKYINTVAVGLTRDRELCHEASAKPLVFAFHTRGWFLDLARGTLSTLDGDDHVPYVPGFRSKDVVTVELVDGVDGGALTFYKNGASLGVAKTGVLVSPDTPLYPVVVSHDRGVHLDFVCL